MKALDFNGESFFVAFRKAKKRYVKYVTSVNHEYHLTPNQIEILIFLQNNPELNTAKDMVSYASVSKGLVSRSIDSLIQSGYLTAESDRFDGRMLRLIPTPAGKKVMEKLAKTGESYIAQMIEGIPKEDLNTCYHTILSILDNIRSMAPEEKP